MSIVSFTNEPASVIIDAKDYYREVWDKIQQAKKRIYICGWDIHSQVELLRDYQGEKSTKLADLLYDNLVNNPVLEIYILIWDFASFYSLERELFADIKFKWKFHERLFFKFDDQYPVGGSHHQKFFIVDEALAYSGGIDITQCRWDTSEHKINNPLREDPNNDQYAPFHDIQAKVSGAPAKEISEAFRKRWNRVNSKKLSPLEEPVKTTQEKFQFENLNIEISYTYGAFKDADECTDIKDLYLKQISQAKEYIYIENQYLTSKEITKSLAQSLKKDEGPAVFIVLPKKAGGWAEEVFMGSQQSKRVQLLQQADHAGRLNIVYPDKKGLKDEYIVIHSKFMIIDGELMRVGSANLSNRSMGLDSECDLSFRTKKTGEFENVLYKLLSEHSGLSAGKVKSLAQNSANKLAFFKSVISRGKNLYYFEPGDPSIPLDILEFGDMERPAFLDRFIDSSVRPKVKYGMRDFVFRWWKSTIVIILLSLALYAASTDTVQNYFEPAYIKEILGQIRSSFYAVPLSMGLLTALLVVFFPLNILIVATATIFSPTKTMTIIMTSVVLSSVISYFIGNFFGDELYKNIETKSLKKLKKRLKGEGIIPVFLLRTIPIAPYTLINMVAGALKYNPKSYCLGTIIGILPGATLLVVFQKSLLEVFSKPSMENISYLMVPVLIFIALFTFSKRRLSRQ